MVISIREEIILESIRRLEEDERDNVDFSGVKQLPCVQNAGVFAEDNFRRIVSRIARATANHRIIISAPWN